MHPRPILLVFLCVFMSQSEDHECPQCRMPSHFVVPSATLVTDPERKELLVSAYQESLSTIPCRHFEHGVSE